MNASASRIAILGMTVGLTSFVSLWAQSQSQSQSQWQMQGGRMRAVVVSHADEATKRTQIQLRPGKQITIASGETAVHFPSNANGLPASLKFAAAAGARVNIGIAAASAVETRTLQPFATTSFEGTLVSKARENAIQVRTTGAADAELRDYRVSVTVAAGGESGSDSGGDSKMFGIVTRHHETHGCYVFSIDWQDHKVRLERWMGGHHMVLRQLDAPWLTARHTLTMQVEGFRLQCAVDGEVLVHSFDGALGGGAPGIAWVGKQPITGDLLLEPVAAPLASSALVQEGNRAQFHAAVPVAPGHIYVLELALDRPHPWVPRSDALLEPSLMQPAAAPIVHWGDWRNSIGSNVIGEVAIDGTVTCELHLPDLPALRLETVLARVLLVTPDGASIVGVTPSVRVDF